MMQEEKMQELKSNPQQQKMLNEIFAATNDAIKKEFPVFAKLVQADVSNVILQAASKDGQVSAQLTELTVAINEMVSQVGKDLEKQMIGKFEDLKEQTAK